MRMRCSFVAVLLGTACSQTATDPDLDSQSQVDDHGHVNDKQEHRSTVPPSDVFYSLLALSRANYLPLSAKEMSEQSDVIAIGTFIDVAEGMTVVNKYAQVPTALYTLVVTLEVAEGIKGAQKGERIYLEFLHGGAVPPSTYAGHLTQEQALVFLDPAEWQESDAVEYVGVGSGYPKDHRLYRLATPQGFLIAREGKLLQPTAHEESVQLFDSSLHSFDDVAQWYEKSAVAPDSMNPTDGTATSGTGL